MAQDITIHLDDGPIIIEQWGDSDPYDTNPPKLETSTLFRDYFMFNGLS